jgi:hypothetical protein
LKITNKHNVPETLLSLATRDYYSKGRADYSVTEVISPPRIQRLRRKHHETMEQDVSEMLWALLGSALHVVAERGQHPGYITEERLFVEVDGVTLSGAIDIQQNTDQGTHIIDYKFTSVWAVRNEKPEWEAQLNCYAYLIRQAKGETVSATSICAMLRDWSRREAAVKADYPQSPIVMVSVPLWAPERAEEYVRERVRLHRDARVSADWGDELPLCSDEDRWQRPTMYAVKREGRKTALRVFSDEADAKALAEQEGAYVEVRPGEPVRCTGNFCGVNSWCSQYEEYQKANGEKS